MDEGKRKSDALAGSSHTTVTAAKDSKTTNSSTHVGVRHSF
jgi:hypothetical protein